MIETTLQLTHSCKLEHVAYGDNAYTSTCLEYVEHSSDHWHSDTVTTIELTEEQAGEIIRFLKKAFPNA